MRKYKLADGTEFELKPAPLDARSDRLLEFTEIQPPETAAGRARYTRDLIFAILETCAPEGVAARASLADVRDLMPVLADMQAEAFGEAPAPGPDSPKADAPAPPGSGSAPES